MFRLIWLETKCCIRWPVWIVLLILSAILFYGGEVPDFELSLTRALTGIPRFPLASLGEWGRLVLLFGGSVVGGVFALFVSLMTMDSFHPEIVHRKALWSMPEAGKLRMAVAKVLAVTTFATGLVFLGALSALANPANREVLVTAGAAYVLLYFTLTWLQISVWSAFSLFILYLTRSRWIVLVAVTVFSVLWFVLGLMGVLGSSLGLLHRSYLSWSFVSPFAPTGLIPAMLALQTASYGALALLLIGAALWVRGRFPEWRRVRLVSVRVAVGLGVILTIGTVGGGAGLLRSQTAPFGLDDLFAETQSNRPYVWSKNGVLLFYPATYGMVRFFSNEDPPSWIPEIADGRETRYFERAGTMIAERRGNSYRPKTESLVLLFPKTAPYPRELESAVRRLQHEMAPLLERAALWYNTTEIFITPPGSGAASPKATPDGLLISDDELGSRFALDLAVWALTEPSALAEPERIYLCLYLTAEWDEEKTAQDLSQLRKAARGEYEPPPERPWDTRPVRNWDPTWGADMAVRIVELWEQGETLGHPDYIRSLVKGEAS